MKRIGGEFDITPVALNGLYDVTSADLPFLYANGRNALKAILEHVKQSGYLGKIHLPFYICSSVVAACKEQHFEVAFYELDDDFTLPLSYLREVGKEEVLLTVCYFGLVDDTKVIDAIKQQRKDICCISDHVMSFWTWQTSNADYSFTSLRKHFAIPEGGLIHAKDPSFTHSIDLAVNGFFKDKFLGGICKSAHVDDAIYLRFFESGEQDLDSASGQIFQSSIYSRYLYMQLNLEEIKEQRSNNANFVYEQGTKMGLNFVFKDKAEGSLPQHIPIWIKNSQKLRSGLRSKHIYLPNHWPGEAYNKSSTCANTMQLQSVSLVIDHRYNLEDMERMLHAVVQFEKMN